MCGIAGYFGSVDDRVGGPALRAMADAMKHRGPDDEGYYEARVRDDSARIGLAHRRLSIIDVVTGHQPICNEDGTIHVVFNGEIYNFGSLRDELVARGHSFRTNSDTETIVHAYEEWGDSCVDRFRGMFAFAVWDSRTERLFLARDRFGKKPLFYLQCKGFLLFASEIKAILAFPGVQARVDLESLSDYFSYRYVPGPGTLFRGIRKLMPGCIATHKNDRLTEERYYFPPDREPRQSVIGSGDPVEVFFQEFHESVRLRMVSDVPFGAFLSGGIDSSAVVSAMTRYLDHPVTTFSVGFSEGEYSELRYARDIADLFHTRHHELIISQEQVTAHLPALVSFRDAPVTEPSDIPIYLLSKEAAKSVKMVLTGEGADELLGGYPKHAFERYVRAYQWLPGVLRQQVLEPLIRALPYRFRRAKTALINLGIGDFGERMPGWFGALAPRERAPLIALAARRTSVEAPQFDSYADNSALRRILYFDQSSWLPDNLLERGDRMTMAASIEARMPFVDHKLAAYVSSLPDRYRVNGHTGKWILRESMKRVLPASILNRPKVGFRVPVNEWFRTSMHEYLMDHLTGPDSRTRNYYHSAALSRVLGEHFDQRQNHEKLLWCLLNLEIWHREYRIST